MFLEVVSGVKFIVRKSHKHLPFLSNILIVDSTLGSLCKICSVTWTITSYWHSFIKIKLSSALDEGINKFLLIFSCPMTKENGSRKTLEARTRAKYNKLNPHMMLPGSRIETCTTSIGGRQPFLPLCHPYLLTKCSVSIFFSFQRSPYSVNSKIYTNQLSLHNQSASPPVQFGVWNVQTVLYYL